MVINTASVSDAAWRLRTILVIVAVLHGVAIVGLALAVIFNPEVMGNTLAAWAGYPDTTRMLWQDLALLGISCLNLFFWVMVFALAARVFGQIADGYADTAANCARQLALLFWAIFVWALLEPTVLSLISTWHKPEGQRSLAIAFHGKQLHFALSALVMGCMARALSLGAELWRDHQEVV